MSDLDFITSVLDRYALFEPNDAVTWNKIKNLIPKIEIDDILNTPETIAKNILRFKYKNIVYEYGNKDGFPNCKPEIKL